MTKISKRPDGRWWTRVSVGKDPATGNLKRLCVYGDTKKEVQKKVNEILGKIQNGTYVEPTNITLETWLYDWLNGRKSHVEESTWNLYELMIRQHINPILGDYKLSNLTTRDIQYLLNEKYENGRIDGKGGLSPRTVKYIYQTLNTALRQAVKERIIAFNVAEAVELPKQSKKEMKVLSIEELEQFFVAAKDSPYIVAFWLILSTGLRKGELLGLCWQDINFDEKKLNVRRQLVRSKKSGLVLKDTKTEKSKRMIVLNQEAITMLKSHKKQQNEIKLRLGCYDEKENKYGYHDINLVFCSQNGKPLDPKNFIRHFKNLLKKAGLPKDIRVHDCRHTYATLSLEAGIPLKTVSEVLGHSTITITADVYSHVTDKMKIDAAEKMGNLLAPIIKK